VNDFLFNKGRYTYLYHLLTQDDCLSKTFPQGTRQKLDAFVPGEHICQASCGMEESSSRWRYLLSAFLCQAERFLAYRSKLPRLSKQIVVGGAVCSAYKLGSGVASRHECIIVASQSVVSSWSVLAVKFD
jgi:hypothetical protein